MRTIKMLFAACLTLGLAYTAQAQSVDEIVAKNIAAMGGADKLASLKTVKESGSLSTQGVDVTLTMTKTQNVGLRLDMEIMGTSNYQVANAKEGYVFMPIMGMADPKAMTPEQHADAMEQTNLQGEFLGYKEAGAKLTLDGSEKVNGKEAFKLTYTPAKGKSKTLFVDKENYRIVRQVSTADVNGSPTEITADYTDYKQNADGFWFPYSVTTMQGTINFDKIETNVAVDNSIYNG